ncbi:hypothetical protein E2C01_089601 [Portunus trituberculatus]|uniref:Uncharacterized protein n=1 Tax=Portunus trituberculatus TaxID=210409 RepID=A0A5B7JJ86_PORTR|nr:hypothetical protein [Portunus trituberculatus]
MKAHDNAPRLAFFTIKTQVIPPRLVCQQAHTRSGGVAGVRQRRHGGGGSGGNKALWEHCPRRSARDRSPQAQREDAALPLYRQDPPPPKQKDGNFGNTILKDKPLPSAIQCVGIEVTDVVCDMLAS